jgi:hypothetical protein
MSKRSQVKDRATRNGTASIYAGSEPRRDELTAHLPKAKKIKRRRFPPSKRAMRLQRQDKANKHADVTAYQARLTAPWPIYVRAKEGG